MNKLTIIGEIVHTKQSEMLAVQTAMTQMPMGAQLLDMRAAFDNGGAAYGRTVFPGTSLDRSGLSIFLVGTQKAPRGVLLLVHTTTTSTTEHGRVHFKFNFDHYPGRRLIGSLSLVCFFGRYTRHKGSEGVDRHYYCCAR